MAAKHLALVWDSGLNTTGKLLLAYLAECADQDGYFMPRETAQLAEAISRNTKTTLKALRTLEENSVLSRGETAWRIKRYHRRDFSELPNYIPPPDEQLPQGTALPHSAERDVATEPPKPAPNSAGDEPVKDAPAVEAEPPPTAEENAEAGRLLQFCKAWGLSMPSANLAAAWLELEQSEAKHNRTERHSDGPKKWTVEHEAIDEILPAILQAVDVFQARAEAGIPNHAATPVDFLNMQLWLAPDYQHAPGAEVAKQYPVSELDDMVMEMNRAGGVFATHLRMTSKNPHTGELETETDHVYQNRVLGKWKQYQQKRPYFTE